MLREINFDPNIFIIIIQRVCRWQLLRLFWSVRQKLRLSNESLCDESTARNARIFDWQLLFSHTYHNKHCNAEYGTKCTALFVFLLQTFNGMALWYRLIVRCVPSAIERAANNNTHTIKTKKKTRERERECVDVPRVHLMQQQPININITATSKCSKSKQHLLTRFAHKLWQTGLSWHDRW